MDKKKTYSANSIQSRAVQYWAKCSRTEVPKGSLSFCYVFWVTFLFAPLAWLFNHQIVIPIPGTKTKVTLLPITVLISLPFLVLLVLGIVVMFFDPSWLILELIIWTLALLSGPLTVTTVFDFTYKEEDEPKEAFVKALLVIFSFMYMWLLHVWYWVGLVFRKLQGKPPVESKYKLADTLKDWLSDEFTVKNIEIPVILPVLGVTLVFLILASGVGEFLKGVAGGIATLLVIALAIALLEFLVKNVIKPISAKVRGIEHQEEDSFLKMALTMVNSTHRKMCPLVELEQVSHVSKD